MNTEAYARAREKDRSNAEMMGQKRQEKALREFKQVLEDLVFLLRSASGMETVYLYWVNRNRDQFVMETKSTALSNVMFQDRLQFEDHFLNTYKDIDEPLSLEIGEDISVDLLTHYYDQVPIKYVTLLPFLNNGETVAITVLESREQIFTDAQSEVIYSYIDALRNVLNTYLEISDLYEKNEEWIDYEKQLSIFDTPGHRADLIIRMMNSIQRIVPDGGVSLVARGMNDWCNVYNAEDAQDAPPLGLPLEERTLAFETLQKGAPEFNIHFNNNPKRLSPRERQAKGATLAVPLMLNDRRQGVVLVYDENPLVFKESTKHKIINLVRIAALKILAGKPGLDTNEPILANEYGAHLPDLWERVIDTELFRLRNRSTEYHTWVGLITPSNLAELRTKLRLEDLALMQKDLVSRFNPGRFGVPGIIGFNSDYVYTFIIQHTDSEAMERWKELLRKELANAVKLSDGQQIRTGIQTGVVKLNPNQKDSYQVMQDAKSALNKTIRESQGTGRS